VRIVHFSDVHYGRPRLSLRALTDKRLLGTANYLLRRRGDVDETAVERLLARCRELKPDLIVCSGDISCVGSPAEFAAAVEKLSPFLALPDSTFVYIPGNHDAYVRASDSRKAMLDACHALNPDLADPLAPFQTVTVETADVAIIPLAQPTNIFLSTGTLRPQSLDGLRRWTRKPGGEGMKRLLVGHFPTATADGKPLGWRRQLNGGKHIAEMLDEGGLDIYLCGHIHSHFVRHFDSGSLECCAGSLTMKNAFARIDIDHDGHVTHHRESV